MDSRYESEATSKSKKAPPNVTRRGGSVRWRGRGVGSLAQAKRIRRELGVARTTPGSGIHDTARLRNVLLPHQRKASECV